MNHLEKRAKERYGLDVTRKDIYNMGEFIRTFFLRPDCRQKKFVIPFNGKFVVVLYDHKVGVIKTFLPRWKASESAKEKAREAMNKAMRTMKEIREMQKSDLADEAIRQAEIRKQVSETVVVGTLYSDILSKEIEELSGMAKEMA